MDDQTKTKITVQVIINAPIAAVWKSWTTPDDIRNWNNASPDWHTPWAENDLTPGGKFNYRMEARDGSFGFEFHGIYTMVEWHHKIELILGDGRAMQVVFNSSDGITEVVETFEAEEVNTLELQRFGWQSILDNFKKYIEANR
jgi:uncharacterized protein YndB with AHSA1/START domain